VTFSENLYNTSELKDEKSEHHNQIYWLIFGGIISIIIFCTWIAFFCYKRKKFKKETPGKSTLYY
jgi:hypothetical protein